MLIFHESHGEVYGFTENQRSNLTHILHLASIEQNEDGSYPADDVFIPGFEPNGFDVYQNGRYIGVIYPAYNGEKYSDNPHPTIVWEDEIIHLEPVSCSDWPRSIEPQYIAKWKGGSIEFGTQTLEACIKKVRDNVKPEFWSKIQICGYEPGTTQVIIELTGRCHGY